MDPARASAFRHAMGDQVIVYLGCQFWWHFGHGFWSPSSPALEHSATIATFLNASVPVEGGASVKHVRTVSPPACSQIISSSSVPVVSQVSH